MAPPSTTPLSTADRGRWSGSEPSWIHSRWGTFLAAALIVVAGLTAYANSFSVPFLYDDLLSIVDNPSLRQLWPIGKTLSPPCNGETVTGRPVLNLSFAINFAIGGTSTWGYHAINLAVHVLNGLLLLGILRRTFQLPVLRPRFGNVALRLALAITLLWTLHPLQTESVTYIVQRAESLASLFYLLVLYGVIRGTQSPRAQAWYVLAVAACLVGAATKEIVCTAPLVVMLYDRTFVEGSFREAFRRRWGLYVGLAASWGLLAGLIWSTGPLGHQGEMPAPDAWSYARSQPGVILHYLKLSLWPSRLCFSLEWPVADTLVTILPPMLAVGLLVAATVWGLLRRSAEGFLGAWFFLILAPTSSVLPLHQLAIEHRMYLPLAGVITLIVAGGYLAGQRLTSRGSISERTVLSVGVCVVALVGVVMGLQTFRRNDTYQNGLSIWQDTVNKAPHNAIAHNSLGFALIEAGRSPEAIEHFQDAIRLQPHHAFAHYNLGNILLQVGRQPEAVEHYQQAVRLKPDFAPFHHSLGNALSALGRESEAMKHYEQAVRIKPDCAESHNNLASALARFGRLPQALEHLQEAARLKPADALSQHNLALTLWKVGRISEAIGHAQEAVRLSPTQPEFVRFAAWLLATHEASEGGNAEQSVKLAEKACGLTSRKDTACLDTLAAALASAGRFDEAVTTAKKAWQMAQAAGQSSLAEEIHIRLQLYRDRKPYREPVRGAAKGRQ
jgi:tetratricopeptide (TPR) repeat protein